MNAKTAKALRKEARIVMASAIPLTSKRNAASDAYQKAMTTIGTSMGVTTKQVKRAVRIAAKDLGKKLPEWAQQNWGGRGLIKYIPFSQWKNFFRPTTA